MSHEYKFKNCIYYWLIISIIRSKRQESDCMDSVQIRKGEDLTYLTFICTTELIKMYRFLVVVIVTEVLGKQFMSIGNHYMFEYK